MKLFLALILCGMTIVLASESCSDEESNKCGRGSGIDEDNMFPDDVATLDKNCPLIKDAFDCQLSYVARCPHTLIAAFHENLKDYRLLFQNLCDRNSDLRTKYLRNISCLNRVTKDVLSNCESSESTDLDYCKRNEAVFKCAHEGVLNACGAEAAEVFDAQIKPKKSWFKVFCQEE